MQRTIDIWHASGIDLHLVYTSCVETRRGCDGAAEGALRPAEPPRRRSLLRRPCCCSGPPSRCLDLLEPHPEHPPLHQLPLRFPSPSLPPVDDELFVLPGADDLHRPRAPPSRQDVKMSSHHRARPCSLTSHPSPVSLLVHAPLSSVSVAAQRT